MTESDKLRMTSPGLMIQRLEELQSAERLQTNVRFTDVGPEGEKWDTTFDQDEREVGSGVDPGAQTDETGRMVKSMRALHSKLFDPGMRLWTTHAQGNTITFGIFAKYEQPLSEDNIDGADDPRASVQRAKWRAIYAAPHPFVSGCRPNGGTATVFDKLKQFTDKGSTLVKQRLFEYWLRPLRPVKHLKSDRTNVTSRVEDFETAWEHMSAGLRGDDLVNQLATQYVSQLMTDFRKDVKVWNRSWDNYIRKADKYMKEVDEFVADGGTEPSRKKPFTSSLEKAHKSTSVLLQRIQCLRRNLSALEGDQAAHKITAVLTIASQLDDDLKSMISSSRYACEPSIHSETWLLVHMALLANRLADPISAGASDICFVAFSTRAACSLCESMCNHFCDLMRRLGIIDEDVGASLLYFSWTPSEVVYLKPSDTQGSFTCDKKVSPGGPGDAVRVRFGCACKSYPSV